MNTLDRLEEEMAVLMSGEEIDADAVERLMLDVREKRDAFGSYISDLVDRATMLRQRVVAMEARARRFERKAESLRHLAAMVMRKHGRTKMEGDEVTMTLLGGRESVVIDDERAVPDNFKETKTVVVKSAVGDALREGAAVPGAHLETGPDTVRVYR